MIGINTTIPRSICIISFSFFSCVFCIIRLLNRSIEEVNYAVLENNGKLSVFENSKDYPLPIIIDGNIDYDVLKDMKKDKKWIYKILDDNNITLDNVFYAFYTKNKTYIIKKDELE